MNRTSCLEKLAELGIPYTITQHQAVHTIEDMVALKILDEGTVAKNLFVRDQKGKNHFLIVLSSEKSANLAKIAELIDSTKLSFGSADRLMKHLGLEAGAVSPLGVVNNVDHNVTVIFDRDFRGVEKIGVHPCDNTATVWLSFADLERYVTACGNDIQFIKI